MPVPIYADNDWNYSTVVLDVNQTTGAPTPVVSEGAVTGWVVAATSPADAALIDVGAAVAVATCFHIGTVPADEEDLEADPPIYRLGTWAVHVDADNFSREIADPVFADEETPLDDRPSPYLIVDDPSGIHVLLPLSYHQYKKATVEA